MSLPLYTTAYSFSHACLFDSVSRIVAKLFCEINYFGWSLPEFVEKLHTLVVQRETSFQVFDDHQPEEIAIIQVAEVAEEDDPYGEPTHEEKKPSMPTAKPIVTYSSRSWMKKLLFSKRIWRTKRTRTIVGASVTLHAHIKMKLRTIHSFRIYPTPAPTK